MHSLRCCSQQQQPPRQQQHHGVTDRRESWRNLRASGMCPVSKQQNIMLHSFKATPTYVPQPDLPSHESGPTLRVRPSAHSTADVAARQLIAPPHTDPGNSWCSIASWQLASCCRGPLHWVIADHHRTPLDTSQSSSSGRDTSAAAAIMLGIWLGLAKAAAALKPPAGLHSSR